MLNSLQSNHPISSIFQLQSIVTHSITFCCPCRAYFCLLISVNWDIGCKTDKIALQFVCSPVHLQIPCIQRYGQQPHCLYQMHTTTALAWNKDQLVYQASFWEEARMEVMLLFGWTRPPHCKSQIKGFTWTRHQISLHKACNISRFNMWLRVNVYIEQ